MRVHMKIPEFKHGFVKGIVTRELKEQNKPNVWNHSKIKQYVYPGSSKISNIAKVTDI